ncbi:MAG: hypothetical protein FWG80_01300 [Alphaproteobacteria bacterium]|nr:hypothetical protein [Alphaproteobacteria bacterium]
MNFIKIHLKLIIGILALGMVAAMFFMSMKPSDLEEGDLRAWLSATSARRQAAIEILTGGSENIGIMVACIDRMAGLPESGKVKVRDAASLCAVGIALRENNRDPDTQ